VSFSAINTSTAALKVTQAAIGVVSQNVANAGTAGYVKRTLQPVVTNGANGGVSVGGVERALDAIALKQLRLETAGAAYTAQYSAVVSQIDSLFGIPGAPTSLDGVLNSYTQALGALASDPSSAPARFTALSAAGTLASSITKVGEGIQTLRTGIESQLATDVEAASRILSAIAGLNAKISANTDTATGANLLDQRDQYINNLAQYLDIQVTTASDGSQTVATRSGLTLVDHGTAASLTFDGRGTLTENDLYDIDSTKRGVGTITATLPGGAKIDLLADKALSSGSIAAAIELRDTTLVQAQRQIDELAAGLSRATTDRAAPSAAVAGGFSIDLAGLQAGNTINLSVNTPSGPRSIILVPSDTTPAATVRASDTNNPNAYVVSFARSTTPATQAANIQAALRSLAIPGFSSAGFSASAAGGQSVSIVHTTATAISAVAADVTVPVSGGSLAGGNVEIPIFVDSGNGNGVFTGSFDSGSQLRGFAQRIAINPAIKSDTSTLVLYSSTTLAGDATRPNKILDALTTQPRVFSAASGIGGVDAPYTATVADFAQRVIDAQGANAASASQLNEGQQIALSTTQQRFATASGVSIDEELAQLITLQNAYTANARVLTAARDMLDALLRI
jgi:flagellar hook-associated protein 1 FlgK